MREIRKKKTKLGAIITRLNKNDVQMSLPKQAMLASCFTSGAASVMVHGEADEFSAGNPIRDGLNYVQRKKGPPTLKFAMSDMIGRFRGDVAVGFCNADVQLDKDFEEIWNFVDQNKMERTWAFKILNDDGKIIFVGVSGSLLEHIFHTAPEALIMGGQQWLDWLDQWATKTVMRHRYVDATTLGIVSPYKFEPEVGTVKMPEPVKADPVEPEVVDAIVEESVKEPEKIEGFVIKRGRKKK